MSFHKYLISEILLVMLLTFSENVEADYENNPFFQGGNRPGAVQTSSNKPPVTQPPVILPVSLPSTTTKEPIFTIEPPEILYGNKLHKKCLKPRGQFPSDSCKKYVNCWDSVAVEQTCLGNFLFNPVKLYCDYPENVDCQGKPITLKATSAPTVVPNNKDISASSVLKPFKTVTSNSVAPDVNSTVSLLRKLCLRSTGLFPGSSCGKFVNCWDDNAVELDCPTGLYFSSEGYCDYSENVQCHSLSSDEEIPIRAESKHVDCPLEFGNFRNRSSCGQYYTCAFHKIAARYHCPDGFSFSDILGICDYSYRVDCSKEPQIFDIRASKNGRCTVINGLMRDQENCSSYYVCDSGKVVANYFCPSGFKFSNELGICDYEEKVNCNNSEKVFEIGSSNMVVPNTVSNEVLSQVQKCVAGSVFRLNPQCTSVCRCRNDIAEIIQCSAGLAYDSKMDKCVLAHLARW